MLLQKQPEHREDGEAEQPEEQPLAYPAQGQQLLDRDRRSQEEQQVQREEHSDEATESQPGEGRQRQRHEGRVEEGQHLFAIDRRADGLGLDFADGVEVVDARAIALAHEPGRRVEGDVVEDAGVVAVGMHTLGDVVQAHAPADSGRNRHDEDHEDEERGGGAPAPGGRGQRR